MKRQKKVITNRLHLVVESTGQNCFFGYYDITPFNEHNEVLYIKAGDKSLTADVMLYKMIGGESVKLAETNVWNWQQGCRLRWMPGQEDAIVYNDFDGKDYCCQIKNIKTAEVHTIDTPLYDIAPDGKMGLSLDFAWLGVKRPGYGYTRTKYVPANLESDGIDLVNLSDGSKTRLFTYKEIAAAVGKAYDFNDCYLNHISYSPSGEKFLFFWLSIENGFHMASLIVYDFASQKLIPLETEEKVSHYVWENDEVIICMAYNKEGKCFYYRYYLDGRPREILCPEILNRDGHPSMYKDNVILTDTYPDGNGYQHLFLANLAAGEKTTILDIYSNCKCNGERRTDLHPRFNLNKDVVSIDSNPNTQRQMLIINI